mgnify:FL=1
MTLENENDIEKAISALNGFTLDGRQLKVEKVVPRDPSQRFERSSRPFGRGGRFPDRPRRPRGPPSDTLIYVGNVPYSMTTEDLKTMFGKYEIQDAYIVCRPNGSSKGFGFVNAANNEVQKAILEDMKEAMVDERRLNIRQATSEGPYGTEEGHEEGASN